MSVIELIASHEGRSLKNCPTCTALLHDEALGCLQCGAQLSQDGRMSYVLEPAQVRRDAETAVAQGGAWGVGSLAPYRSPRSLTVASLIAFAILAMLDLAFVAAFVRQLVYIERLKAGINVPMADLLASDDLIRVLGLVAWPVVLLVGVEFLAWFYVAYRNLKVLSVKAPEHSAGFAVGAYFIPFVSLVFPYLTMREVWRGSNPGARRTAPPGSRSADAGWLVSVWWGLFLVRVVPTIVATVMSAVTEPTLEQLIIQTWWSIAIYIVSLAGIAVTVALVVAVCRRQDVCYRSIIAPSPVDDTVATGWQVAPQIDVTQSLP